MKKDLQNSRTNNKETIESKAEIIRKDLKIVGFVLIGFIVFGIVAPKRGEIILEYLKIFISWPVVSLILGFIFLKWFKEPISDFFGRITKGEGYGLRIEARSPMEQRKEVKESSKQLDFQDKEEQYVKEHPREAIKEHQRTFNAYWFERSYNLIYGTQVDLLEHLSTKGDRGEKYINLVMFYNEFLKRSKLSTIQMADYLGFLKDSLFVEYKGDNQEITVKIIPYGTDFLSYIKTQYPIAYKYKPF